MTDRDMPEEPIGLTRASLEAVNARTKMYHAIIRIAGILVFFFGVAIFSRSLAPLVNAISARPAYIANADIITIAAVLAVSTIILSVGLVIEARRAARYKQRAEQLAAKLESIQK